MQIKVTRSRESEPKRALMQCDTLIQSIRVFLANCLAICGVQIHEMLRMPRAPHHCEELSAFGADDGNRTRVFGLGSGHSAIELHLHLSSHLFYHQSPKKSRESHQVFPSCLQKRLTMLDMRDIMRSNNRLGGTRPCQ